MLISKADIFLSSDIHGYLVAFLSPFGYQAGYPGPLSVAIHEYLGYPITISTPFPGYPSILPLWALPAPPPGPLLCASCSQNVYLLTRPADMIPPPGPGPCPAPMRPLLSKRSFTHTVPEGPDPGAGHHGSMPMLSAGAAGDGVSVRA